MSVLAPGATSQLPDEPIRTVRTRFPDDEASARYEVRLLVRRALVTYVVTSVAALGLVGLAASVVAHRVAAESAVDDAAVYTQQFSQLVVAPYVTQGLVDGDPAAVAALDEVVRLQMSEHEVLRVKVWSAAGDILYSDEPRLIGRRYTIDEADRPLLTSMGITAEVSDSTKPENEFETGFGQTLEVYAGIRAMNGDPVLVEAYLPVSRLHALRDDLVRRIVPLVVLALLTLELLLLPLGIFLTRRIARSQQERATLSRLAAHAAEAERHSIAAELHDGVIQDLVAVGFGLGTVRAVAERHGHADVSAAAQQLNDIVRDDVRVLRGMITSLSVRDFAATPLHAVVLESSVEAERAGLVVRRDIRPVEPASRDGHTALCLVVREAVRNAVRHAQADTLLVRLAREGDDLVLEVADDGVGFDPTHTASATEGHLGLTLYALAARAANGRYTLRTAAGEGTRLTLRVPSPVGERTAWRRRSPRRSTTG